MDLDQILNFITNISFLSVLKIFLLIFLLFYICFAWVILRQEKFMAQVIEVPISSILTVLVNIHFWASIGLFIFGLFVL